VSGPPAGGPSAGRGVGISLMNGSSQSRANLRN
jgi:hypothetical protein